MFEKKVQEMDNEAFNYFEQFSRIIEPDENKPAMLAVSVPLSALLPSDTSSFYRYNGSLTAPDCNENVIWTVFDTPIAISERQVGTLKFSLNHLHAILNVILYSLYSSWKNFENWTIGKGNLWLIISVRFNLWMIASLRIEKVMIRLFVRKIDLFSVWVSLSSTAVDLFFRISWWTWIESNLQTKTKFFTFHEKKINERVIWFQGLVTTKNKK